MLAQDAPIRETLQRRLVAAVLVGAAIAAVAFFFGVGIRPNILAIAHTPRFLFKVLFAAALMCCAAGVVFRVGRPDAEIGSWRAAFGALIVVLGFAVAIELMVTPGGGVAFSPRRRKRSLLSHRHSDLGIGAAVRPARRVARGCARATWRRRRDRRPRSERHRRDALRHPLSRRQSAVCCDVVFARHRDRGGGWRTCRVASVALVNAQRSAR